MALSDFFTTQPATQPVQMNRGTGTQQALSSLEQVVGSGSPYIQNARQRGMELAATRGGINSSIAAGAAERSALEAAAPIVQAGLNIDQAQQNVQYENWLNQQNFNRSLQGAAFDANLRNTDMISQFALQDPELYSPDVVSGYTNFFSQNLREVLNNYFGKPSSGGTI